MNRHFERMGVVKHTYLFVDGGVDYFVRAEKLRGGGFLLSLFLSEAETVRVASKILPADAPVCAIADFVVEFQRGEHVE